MADKLRVGFVTVEPHGYPWIRVLDRFMKDEVEAVAVWDYDDPVAQKFAKEWDIDVVQEPEDMVGKVDAVFVAGGRRSPGENEVWGGYKDDHLELSRPFLEAGLPVMVDKPLADTVEDAVEMIRLAKANNALLMSCSANRYTAEVMSLRESIESGDLGKIIGARCTLGSGLSTFGWYLIHVMEALHILLGSGIESVYAIPSGDELTMGRGPQELPAAHATIVRWRDGKLATILQLRDETEGSVGTSMRGPRYLWPTDGIVPPYLPLLYDVRVYGTMYYQDAVPKGKSCYRRNVRAFLVMIETGELPFPLEAPLEITQAVAAAERSAESGQLERLIPVEELMP